MSMSPGRARQQVADGRKKSSKKADPLVIITEWAIPNLAVAARKRRELWWANLPCNVNAAAYFVVGMVFFLSGYVVFLSFVSMIAAVVGGASEEIRITFQVLAGSSALYLVDILIGYALLPPVSGFEWIRLSISSFGWGNIPAEGVRRAKFIQQEFPGAYIAVDALGADPYLVAIIEEREYFFYQWN